MAKVKGFEVTKDHDVFAILKRKINTGIVGPMAWANYNCILDLDRRYKAITRENRQGRRRMENGSQTSGDSVESKNQDVREGGAGGGLSEYKIIEPELKEFGHIKNDRARAQIINNPIKIEDPKGPDEEVDDDIEEGDAPHESLETQTTVPTDSMPDVSHFTPLNPIRSAPNPAKPDDGVRMFPGQNGTGYPDGQASFDNPSSLPHSTPHPDYGPMAPYPLPSPTPQHVYFANQYLPNGTESTQQDNRLNMHHHQPADDGMFSPPQQPAGWFAMPGRVDYSQFGEMNSLNVGGNIDTFQTGDMCYTHPPNYNYYQQS